MMEVNPDLRPGRKRGKRARQTGFKSSSFCYNQSPFKKPSDHFRHIMNLDGLQDLWQTLSVHLHMVHITFIDNKAHGT